MLSLTLRVVFNLFNCMKRHLKVQLEVFFTSVHLCISNSKSARAEHRELALESLLVCAHALFVSAAAQCRSVSYLRRVWCFHPRAGVVA